MSQDPKYVAWLPRVSSAFLSRWELSDVEISHAIKQDFFYSSEKDVGGQQVGLGYKVRVDDRVSGDKAGKAGDAVSV